MANNATHLTITGNLTRDPEGSVTPSGVYVARLSIAVTPRRFDKLTNSWTDGETTFWACSAWRSLGENITESLRKGDRVIAAGTVTTQRWTDTQTGEARERMVLELDDIGPSLTWATATVTKSGRRAPAPTAGDPWNVPAATPVAVGATPTDVPF